MSYVDPWAERHDRRCNCAECLDKRNRLWQARSHNCTDCGTPYAILVSGDKGLWLCLLCRQKLTLANKKSPLVQGGR